MIDLSMDKNTNEIVVEETVDSVNVGEVKSIKRPPVLDARVYKLKSGFINNALYITISYVKENGKNRPFEVFINTKDLSKAPEYAVLTRLISAIFRRGGDTTFILEELRSIYDPNGGMYKEGKYVPSLYSEIADLLETAFIDLGVMEEKEDNGANTHIIEDIKKDEIDPAQLKICPKCNRKSLVVTNGCFQCIEEDCLYSKCS